MTAIQRIEEMRRAMHERVSKMKRLDEVDLDWLTSLSAPRRAAWQTALFDAGYTVERDDVRGRAWLECEMFGADCTCNNHQRIRS